MSYPARDSEVKRPKVKSVAKKVSRSVAAVAEWKRVSKAGSSAKGNTVKTGPAEYVIVPKSKVAHDEQVKRPVPPEGVKSTASSTVPKPSNAAPEQVSKPSHYIKETDHCAFSAFQTHHEGIS